MIHFNTVEFSTITLKNVERDASISRKITSIYGLPFYCSSGANSNFDGTWFPFYGISPYRSFVKKMTADNTLPEMFYTLFAPSVGYQAYKVNSDLAARFGSLACLLLSSCFGGGLWNTAQGMKLLAHLKEIHADFYRDWPTMLLNDPEKIVNEDNLFYINNWLVSKAHVTEPKQLASISPSTIEDLFALKSKSELYIDIDQPQQKLCCLLL